MDAKELVEAIKQNRDQFTNDFIEWLPDNWHIYLGFRAEALKLIAAGRTHYSAMLIVYVLRHYSMLREVGTQWKISNQHMPYLARVFALEHPEHADFFQYKRCPAAERDAQQRLMGEVA